MGSRCIVNAFVVQQVVDGGPLDIEKVCADVNIPTRSTRQGFTLSSHAKSIASNESGVVGERGVGHAVTARFSFSTITTLHPTGLVPPVGQQLSSRGERLPIGR